MKMHFAKPGSMRAPAAGKTPKLGDALAKSPQRMSGGRMWHPGPGIVTNLNGRLLHPDTVAERGRRGLPPIREPLIGEANPDGQPGPDIGGY